MKIEDIKFYVMKMKGKKPDPVVVPTYLCNVYLCNVKSVGGTSRCKEHTRPYQKA
jgi:hypothetical protein